MHIVKTPKVYLVGKQIICDDGMNDFLADHNVGAWNTDTDVASEALPEIAGRLCYMSFVKPRPGGNTAYLSHIKEVGHGSVLEHSVWNFIITGVSRSLTHELVRHRLASYSQRSQRYVDESEANFIEPECIRTDTELHDLWTEIIEQTQQSYTKLVSKLSDKFLDVPDKTARRKMARQAARSVLPNATETKIFFTANARSLRNFIELRCSEYAETEIRIVSGMILDILQKECAAIFGDYQKIPLPDGTFAVTTQFKKV